MLKKENIDSIFYNANSDEKIEFILNDEIITEIKVSNNKEIENDKVLNFANQFISNNLSEDMDFLYNISKKIKNTSTFLDVNFLINKNLKLDIQEQKRDTVILNRYLSEFKEGAWISQFTKFQKGTADGVKEIIKNKQKKELLELINIFELDIDDIISDEGEILLSKKNIKKMLPLSSFGNGLAAIIDIISSVILKNIKFLFIDEIETGIHYLNYSKLCNALLKLAEKKDIQIFITTHSKEFLEKFYEESENITDSIALYRFQKNKNRELKKIYYSKERAIEALRNGWDIR